MAKNDLGPRIDEVTDFKRKVRSGSWFDDNRIEWRELCGLLLGQLSADETTCGRLDELLKEFDGLKDDTQRLQKADQIKVFLSLVRNRPNENIVDNGPAPSKEAVTVDLLHARLQVVEAELARLQGVVAALQRTAEPRPPDRDN